MVAFYQNIKKPKNVGLVKIVTFPMCRNTIVRRSC